MQSPVPTQEVQSPVPTQEVQSPVSLPATYTLPPATHWVDGTNGSDSNNGTSEVTAWKTITKAANTLTAGQTVYIKASTYIEQVSPANSGTDDNPITYTANPGDTVIIDGQNVAGGDWEGLINISNKQYLNFYGLTVKNARWCGFQLRTNVAYVNIKNCIIDNTVSSGVYSYGYQTSNHHIVVDGNTLTYVNQGTKSVYSGGEYAAQEGISMSSTHDFIISNNDLSHFNKEGIDAKGGSYNGKILNNYVHDAPDKTPERLANGEDLYPGVMGIYIDGGSNIEIAHNRIENMVGGIDIAHEGGGDISDIHVHHNVANGGPAKGPNTNPVMDHFIALIEYSNSGYKSNITIENNTFVGSTFYTTNADPSHIINLIMNDNLFNDTSFILQ